MLHYGDNSMKGVNFKAKPEVDRTTRCGDMAIWNFRDEKSVVVGSQSSVAGRSLVNITLISYTPLRYMYVRNVAREE